MISSIASKIQSFHSNKELLLLLHNLQSLILHYHTSSPRESFPTTLKPSSRPILNPSRSNFFPENQAISDLFTNPTQTHFGNSEFDPSTVLETLNCYANDWKKALQFFNWVEKHGCGFQHTTQTFNKLIDILGKFFEFDMSWDMIERMKKSPCSLPDNTTFRILFKRYAMAHLVNEAIDAFGKLDEYGFRDETSFSNLIDALCEYKHVIEAEQLCFKTGDSNFGDKISGFDVESTKIYNMILRGWFKMEWWRKCREFWELMDEKGVCKDLYSYSIYMDIQSKCGKPWKAVKLYKEMKKKGIKLDAVAFNTVIRAIGISEGVDVALRLYKEMIELGCKPNVATFNTILKLLCDSGRYREAHKVFNSMIKKGYEPNLVTYHCFFVSLEKPREILKLFDRMIETGVRPRMDTYVMLMRKFGRWGFLRPVLHLWKKMQEQGLSPDEFAYNALIDVLLQKGLVDMARKYDDEMVSKGLSAKPRAELQSVPEDERTING